MSSLLNRLVARNLRNTESIRPRAASLFEPVQASLVTPHGVPVPGNDESDVAPMEMQVEVEPQPIPAESQSHSRSQRMHVAGEARSRGEVIDSSATGLADPQQRVPSLNPDVDTRGRRLSPPREDRSVQDQPSPPATRVQVAQAPSNVIERANQTLNAAPPERRLPALREAATPSVLSADQSVSRRERRTPSLVATAHDHERRSTDESRRPAVTPVSSHSTTNPFDLGASWNGRSTPEMREREAEPSIQVTIGRIEIRAEHLQPPVRKAQSTASPVMGLEEYLQRKNKRAKE